MQSPVGRLYMAIVHPGGVARPSLKRATLATMGTYKFEVMMNIIC
jgi:hypothetical protein